MIVRALLVMLIALPPGGARGRGASVYAQSVSARDSTGRIVALAEPAARVVVLSPGAMELLYAIGASSRVFGRGRDCDFPEEALSFPVIDTRSVSSVDLIIADKEGWLPRGGAREARASVFIYDPLDFRELADAAMAIGALVGMENEGIRTATRITDSVKRVRGIIGRLKTSQYPRVFWEACEDPLRTSGSSSFVNSLINEAGGKNIFSDRKDASFRIGRDDVRARSPQITVAITKAGGVENDPIESGRIVNIDQGLGSRVGPRSPSLLLILAKAFHPEIIP